MVGSDVLQIRLLGEPEAEIDGQPIEVDTRKALAILAYLAVEGSTSRDTLTGLLWPEAPQDRARATLRRTLSSLRSGVGTEHLQSDHDRVGLGGHVDLDLRQFQEELAATERHDHDPRDVCPACVPHLTKVAELYRGDFLESFGVGDAPEFEDWMRTVGEGLRLRTGEALSRLAMARATAGDYPGAKGAVSQWIELDPLHEPAYRMLMLLHAWSGDRPAAISSYRHFVALLDRELGVPPLEETSELYEAILDEDLPPAPGVSRRPRAHQGPRQQSSDTLLDREVEVNRLSLALEESRQRGIAVVLIGDSWMGKTRLLEELADRARPAGHAVLAGRASRSEEMVPYAAITTVIRRALTLVAESELELPGWVEEELGRIVPSLAGRRTRPGADPLGDLRFLEAVQHLFEVVTSTQPVVLTIDDGQWLDAASTRLIGYLGRRLEPHPLLLVIALRDADRPETTDLVSLASVHIRLGQLEVSQLGGELTPEEAEAVIKATGGVPRLVLEHLNDPSARETPGVTRYIEDLLGNTSDLARQVLTAAAVLGTARDVSVLRDTSGRSEDEVVQAVEELIGAGLLRELNGGEGIGFALEAAERMVYETTSLMRRRLLHKRAAEAIEALPRADEDARLAAAIATHHQGAGSVSAASWFRRAGDLARDAYAHNEAKRLYENSLALDGDNAGALHLALGELAMAGGDYSHAMTELRSAASRSRGSTLSLVEHRIGEVNRLLGRLTLADESFQRAEAEHPNPASLYADWALLHHRRGSQEEALALAGRALEASEIPEEQSRAHNIMAIAQSEPALARKHIDDALVLAEGRESERMAALNTKARLLAEQGELDGAVDLVSEAIDLATSTGHRHREAALRNQLADLHHRAGRVEEAQHALTEAVEIFADIDTEAREPEIWLLSHW